MTARRVHRHRRGAGPRRWSRRRVTAGPVGGAVQQGHHRRLGRPHDRRYTTHLRDLIISGRARPSQIITHHEALEDAPSIYDRFDRRVDGIVKAVFNH
jgi:glutathione-independent formaldehyde dehydrogenase